MQNDGNVKEVFERLGRGIRAIESGISHVTGRRDVFMQHDILGCITCCPSNLGTGMRGGVHIKIPMLINTLGLHKIDALCRKMYCQARGTAGEHSKVVDRVDISNWRRLGFPEYQLVEDMIKCVNHIVKMEEERTIRSSL